MTQRISELLAEAAVPAVSVLHEIKDDQLGHPTPCAEYDVRALVNHLFEVVVQFQALAAKRDAHFEVTPDHVGAGPDWRDRFAAETQRLVAAWAEPGAEEGTTGAMNFEARIVGAMALGDLAVHGWDLARSVGQGFTVAPTVLAELGPAFGQLAPGARQAGMWGEPVDVPEDATELDRLLALSGRDPRWQPQPTP